MPECRPSTGLPEPSTESGKTATAAAIGRRPEVRPGSARRQWSGSSQWSRWAPESSRPTLPLNLAIVDPLILLVHVIAVAYLFSGGRSRAIGMLASAAPWLWLFMISSFVSLFGVGLAPWAIDNLVRDLGAIMTFFTFLILLDATDDGARKAQAAMCAVGGWWPSRYLSSEAATTCG